MRPKISSFLLFYTNIQLMHYLYKVWSHYDIFCAIIAVKIPVKNNGDDIIE